MPLVESAGDKHKICYKPTETTYTNFNQEKFSFACDPAIEKLNYDAAEWNQRFWIGLKKDGPMNIPGYGPTRKWVPPLS